MTREDSMVIDEILAGKRWIVGFEVINAVRALRESNRSAQCSSSANADMVDSLKRKLELEHENYAALRAAYDQKESALKKAVEELTAADGRVIQLEDDLKTAQADLKKVQEWLNQAVAEKISFAGQVAQQGERAAKSEKQLSELRNAVSRTLEGFVALGKEIEGFFGVSVVPTYGY